MKRILFSTLIALGLVLTGCPYEGPVELNTYEESTKIDKGLIGEWVSYHEDGSRDELTVTKAAKTVFHVEHDIYDSKKRKTDDFYYRVYGTDIEGTIVMNVENKEGKYMFFRYAWTGKNLFYLETIKGEFMEENFKVEEVTTKNLREFITNNMNKPEMFDDKMEFYRKGSPEHEKVKMYMKSSGFK